ncbi:hypothetical protein FBEOM_9224 [Fusarium beomiforme]|uniref:C2H2-type domain-containing protein n=1 Tax=Fusarium beomiforme TaxID=44412 RepID=A0A9P5ADU6_9HYPO|nr:hypothetical protein FBEOM_9224 [Fusarium beomiforme]
MAPFSVPEQHNHPALPLAKLQKLKSLGLFYNLPEAAIICIKCGFALSPNRASEHPGKKHGIARSARHGLKSLLSSLDLPDPNTLAPRPDRSQPHPYLTVQGGSSCKHCGLHSTSRKVLADHLRAKHHDKLKLTGEKKADSTGCETISSKVFYIPIVRPIFTESGNSTSLVGLYPC